MRFVGIMLGLIFLFAATSMFMQSYREGDAKWNYVIMLFGMMLVLFYTIFKKPIYKKRRKK